MTHKGFSYFASGVNYFWNACKSTTNRQRFDENKAAAQFYLVRHGETDFNRKGIIQGRGVDMSINENGIKQAKAFFQQYKDAGFQKVYFSSLIRTRQTIQYFLDEGIASESSGLIDEMDWGIYEGKENTNELKKIFATYLQSWKNGQYNLGAPEGETPLELQARLKQFIAQIESADENKILICTHGRALRVLLCIFLELPLSQMDHFPHQNLCVYKLVFRNGKYNLILSNDTSHLYEKA